MNNCAHALVTLIFGLSLSLSSIALHSAEKTVQTDAKAEKPKAIAFTPPEGWRQADTSLLPQNVKLMVVGKGIHDFPPSISLATEEYKGTMKQYLKRVKEINASKGSEWKDLGTIKSDAGVLNLSQTDSLTEWGKIRMLHVMLKKDGEMYILTAASLRDEFSKFYKDFFDAFKSLRFQRDLMNENSAE